MRNGRWVFLALLFGALLAGSGRTSWAGSTRLAPTLTQPGIFQPRRALTFDDGYDSVVVNRILDILDEAQVRATFFPVSAWSDHDPQTFRRMAARHEIGNHTRTHPFLPRLPNGMIQQEIMDGVPSKLFRPPYGAIDKRVRDVVSRLGMRVVMWDIDSRGWTKIPPAKVAENVLSKAADGKIVLMHMGDSNTAAALPEIIATLTARGFLLVTVSELTDARRVDAPAPRVR